MSDTLFDMTPYKSEASMSYRPDWIDATGSDPAWDEPELHPAWENSTAEPDGNAQDNFAKTPTMAEEKTPEPLHASVEVVEELSPEESADRQRLELKVERAFYEAGKALLELRDRRLYRTTHKSFEEYCKERFGFGRAHSYRLIDAVAVVDNLSLNREDENLSPNRRQVLPTKLEQVRPLTVLEPDEQRGLWDEAVKQAGGKVPSGRVVKGIVERLKEKQLSPATDSYNVGDIFTLRGLSGSERKYNGCWAQAIGVNEFTLEVEVHDTVLTVNPDSLNRIDSPDERRQLPTILKRIKRLRQCGLLDRGAYVVLESLGKQTYLTEVESGLLSWLENHYGVV